MTERTDADDPRFDPRPSPSRSSDADARADGSAGPRNDRAASLRSAERLRQRLGLSYARWTLATSVALFLPYPAFAYALLAGVPHTTVFALATLAYSIAATYLYYRL